MATCFFDYQKLGQNIRTLRLSNHLTQAELAGCSVSTISRLERGICGLSTNLLFDIANALNCRPSELVQGI